MPVTVDEVRAFAATLPRSSGNRAAPARQALSVSIVPPKATK